MQKSRRGLVVRAMLTDGGEGDDEQPRGIEHGHVPSRDVEVTGPHRPTGDEERTDAEGGQAEGRALLDVGLDDEGKGERHAIEIAQRLRRGIANQMGTKHD